MKIAFIHVSRSNENNLSTVLIPTGLLGLADNLQKHGHETEIIHKEIEESENSDFDLIHYLKINNFNLICLDLYYHHQSFSVIEYASYIKQNISNITIVLGGLTATIYAHEIMTEFPFIDFVITGDGERPIVDFAYQFTSQKNWSAVSNLIYRKNNKIMKSQYDYMMNEKDYKSISYSNYSLIKHYELYLRLRLGSLKYREVKQSYYIPGRGCNKNCSFCGASSTVEKHINNRIKPVFKSISSVINDFKRFKRYNITSWSVCYSPTFSEEYYLLLFQRIKKANLRLRLIFDCFNLPSKKFIHAVKETFIEGSVLNLSPFSGSERVRNLNGVGNYSDDSLISVCHQIEKSGLFYSVYFTAGLMYETFGDINLTIRLIKQLRKNFPGIKIISQYIEIEPYSNMIRSSKSEIINNPKCFMDYYRVYKSGKSATYDTRNFTHQEIIDFVYKYNNV